MSPFELVESSFLYRAAIAFYGFYPLFMAIVWVTMSALFFLRREHNDVGPEPYPEELWPLVSILIPAYREEKTLARTLRALLELDYPRWEAIVINDGSPDATGEVARAFLGSGRIRLLDKRTNEGKAMALNDALPLVAGEIVVVLDADIVVTPGVLRALVPHFRDPRVGAVTGNPRVANRGSLLRNLQVLEFSSIVSVQRRAQRIWGRVLTVSGAVMAVRRSALVDAGLFSPDMATEDIDLSWRLQRRFWDVRYEPRGVVWMQVPPNLRELWKQRRRWARGLAQVLGRHWPVLASWRTRRLWPVLVEASLSIAWAYTFVLVTGYWIVAALAGHRPYGASPIPNFWGMLIATACLVQLLAGVLMDRRYDRGILRHYPVAILYPLVYWMLMSLITSIYTVETLLRRRPKVQTWSIARVSS